MKKRALIMVVAIMVAVTAFVGGTLAWFTDSDRLEPSVYTIGNVKIQVSGGAVSGTLLPGVDVYKCDLSDSVADPAVTVISGSVKCYVFVEITPMFASSTVSYGDSVTADSLIDYDMYTMNGSGEVWTELSNNVYYQVVDASANDVYLPIYDKVYTDSSVTKAMFDAIGTDHVSLAVNVYAIQYDGIADVSAAWNAIKPQAASNENVDSSEVVAE